MNSRKAAYRAWDLVGDCAATVSPTSRRTSQERCLRFFLPSRSWELAFSAQRLASNSKINLPSGRFFCSLLQGRRFFMARVEVEDLLPGMDNDKLFNAANEIARASEVLSKHLAPYAVLEWLRGQAEGFLAEFGFGESLSIQPPYWLEISKTDADPQVFCLNLREYGEQAESYRDAPNFPEVVGEGLMSAYRMLSSAQAGEGVIIVSPTDFYKDYGSKYDVANFFRVVEVSKDGSRLVEGRYLLLNRGLTNYQRAFLLNWHSHEAHIPIDASAKRIVKSPQLFRFGELALNDEDPIAAHIDKLRRAFMSQFGKELLGGESDLSLYGVIRELVSQNLKSLHNFVLGKDEYSILRKLKDMMFSSQRVWAREREIDPDVHIEDILFGRTVIGGIHPATGESTDYYKDPFTGEWIAGSECEVNADGRKECPKCHRIYEGEECPQCRKVES